MDVCLRVLKEINKSRFDSYSQEQCIDHISYYLSGLSRAQFFFPTTFLEIAVDMSIKPPYIADRVLQLQCDHR